MSQKPSDDDDLFRQMMSGVKPLSPKKSAERCSPPPAKRHPPSQQHADNAQNITNTDFIPRDDVPDVAPEESLFFARPGLQHHRIRHFKRGDLRPEAQLDLHGYTLAEAATSLACFLSNSRSTRQRCVCVIHGKGHRSGGGRPVLKAQINQWLRDVPFVLAFSSAQAKDGGMGAVYVLLQRQTGCP